MHSGGPWAIVAAGFNWVFCWGNYSFVIYDEKKPVLFSNGNSLSSISLIKKKEKQNHNHQHPTLDNTKSLKKLPDLSAKESLEDLLAPLYVVILKALW